MLQPALYRIGYTAVSFIIGLLLANILAPAFFGKLSLLIVNASIIGLVSGLGADSIVYHLLVNKKWNKNQSNTFIWIIIGIQVILFLIIQLLHIGFTSVTALSQVAPGYILWEMLFFLGLIVTEKYLVLYYSHQGAKVINQLLLGVTLFYLCVLLIVQQNTALTFNGILKLLGVIHLVQACLVLFVYHFFMNPLHFQQVNWIDFKEAFLKSLVIMLTNVVQLLAYRIDFWLISWFHKDYAVGIFAQANKMANLIWIIPNVFALLVIPKFNEIKNERLLSLFRIAILSNLILTILTIMATEFVYHYFLSNEYDLGINAFYLMLPGYFCWAMVIYFGAYFSWLGKFEYNFYASSICLVLILVLDYLLIPAFSINGAAISNTIVYSIVLLVYLFLFCKETGSSITDFVRYQKEDFSLVQKLFNEKG